jgi:hypothetical protein
MGRWEGIVNARDMFWRSRETECVVKIRRPSTSCWKTRSEGAWGSCSQSMPPWILSCVGGGGEAYSEDACAMGVVTIGENDRNAAVVQPVDTVDQVGFGGLGFSRLRFRLRFG